MGLIQRLHAMLQRIKKELPNESGFVSSVKTWIRSKSGQNLLTIPQGGAETEDDRRMKSMIEVFDDIVDVVNSVPFESKSHSTKQFGQLTEDIMNIVVIYAQKGKECDEGHLQHTIGYLWNIMGHQPKAMRKVMSKHKGFMKALKKWNEERDQYGLVFGDIVSNMHSLMTDRSLFEETFMKGNGTMDDEKEKEEEERIEYRCACGKMLVPKKANECYENSSYLYCDLCFSKMGGD